MMCLQYVLDDLKVLKNKHSRLRSFVKAIRLDLQLKTHTQRKKTFDIHPLFSTV